MGNGFLYQSHAAGRGGAIPSRGENRPCGGSQEKIVGTQLKMQEWCALTRPTIFAIIKSSARYPSGPRERSAKPPFVGSNPTRASNLFKHLRFARYPQPGFC